MIEITQVSAIQVDITLGMPNGDLIFNGHIVEMPGGWQLVNEGSGATVMLPGKYPNSLAALTVALSMIQRGVPA